jgi:hypothetical protein
MDFPGIDGTVNQTIADTNGKGDNKPTYNK